MITGLILVGLIIDLGGAPNHHRLGFQVGIEVNSKQTVLLTPGTVLEKLLILQGFYATSELGIPLAVALFCLFKNKKVRFCLLVCAVLIAGMLCVIWFFPHYAAPFTATVFVLVVFGLRRLHAWQVAGRPTGVGLVRALVLFQVALLMASVAGQTLAQRTNRGPWDRGQARARAQAFLESMPGQHLVLVRYSAAHNPGQEWVYNRADIDHTKVVWAREIPGRNPQPLLDYFRGRKVWLVQADADPPDLLPMPEPILSVPRQNSDLP